MISIETVQPQNERERHERISRAELLAWFAAIAAVSFILRIAYVRNLYEDDGLWFAAGEEILRGKALYSQIYFDKPPGLALLYALLFWIFGAHILTIRLFAIAYSVAISAALYFFAARFYSRRIGLLAAALFAVFSTALITGHAQGFATEFLMSLPYTIGAYLFIRSRIGHSPLPVVRSRRGWLALAGGILSGISFQVNPKGVFDLLFFAILLIAPRRWVAFNDDPDEVNKARSSRIKLFAIASAGFALGNLPFAGYIVATHSLRPYGLYVWEWGFRYGGYYGVGATLMTALIRSLDFFALDNTLLIALVCFIVVLLRATKERKPPERDHWSRAMLQADAAILIWFICSYAAVVVGGRLFSHYFFQPLPALCLIGARGLAQLQSWLKRRRPVVRRVAVAIVCIGFAITLVRFHTRSVLMMIDLFGWGNKEQNASWYYSVRNREERMVAAVVTDVEDGSEAIDRLGLEGTRAESPTIREGRGPGDYVFVWGYRPEIYFWSGLLPASRFLSSQPLTGVPADVHYFQDDYRSLLDGHATAQAREQLVRDLETTQPKYIVDELGFFNGDLAILKYPELQEVMGKYKFIGSTGRFLLYIRRDLTKKALRRSAEQH